MRDVFKTKKKRSEVMSRIRSKHTKLDTTMKALLEREGCALIVMHNTVKGAHSLFFSLFFCKIYNITLHLILH